MNKNINCFIVTSKLSQNRREKKEDSSISKEKNSLNITYCENDSLDKFEEDINSLIGKNRTFSYFVNKRFIPLTISFITPLTNNLKSQLAYCTFGCLKKLATF